MHSQSQPSALRDTAMSQSPFIFDATDANFHQVVIENSFHKPVLVDFWAEWCAPCKALMPLLAKIAEEYQGELLLAKVNCDIEQNVVMQMGIRSLPTVVLFRDGQPVDGFAGAQPESAIRAMLEPHVQAPPPVAGDPLEDAQAARLWSLLVITCSLTSSCAGRTASDVRIVATFRLGSVAGPMVQGSASVAPACIRFPTIRKLFPQYGRNGIKPTAIGRPALRVEGYPRGPAVGILAAWVGKSSRSLTPASSGSGTATR